MRSVLLSKPKATRYTMHIPVLIEEATTLLNPKPGDCVIDGTIGGGGHTRALLDRLDGSGWFLGMDWDADAVTRLRSETGAYAERGVTVNIVNGNFSDLPAVMETLGVPKADAVMLDIGFSSDQIESSGRGFSFLRDEPLIMTYSNEMTPVKELLRELSESDLADILFKFGEERYGREIARAIRERIENGILESTRDLVQIVESAVPPRYLKGRIHPATRTFQALRMYANRELENVERFLDNLGVVLAPGGRVAVISFHSLEDRIVKERFRALERAGAGKRLTKKPVVASADEVARNPRSRSAKLRAFKLEQTKNP